MAISAELRQRAISGVALGSAVLFITWWSAGSFAAMCVLGAVILCKEWLGMTRQRSHGFFLAGLAYILAGCAGLVYLRVENLHILFALFAIVWTGDIAGYLFGKRFGKHKIAPAISPGKSWEGLAGSVVVSAIIGAVLGSVAPVPHAILGALFAVLGLGGDMFESAVKRKAGIKDSGSLIPGHGGLFDRVDALLPCAIFAAVALYIRLNLQ
ncbi:MAG: phosphatidate cytidylyltransferase [Rickettsiales bacterium]